MKSYICKNCGYIVETNDISNYVCPRCNSSDNNFDVIEDKLNENEIDAIIGSVIEDDNLDNTSKIVNENNEEKFVVISEDNNCLYRKNEKCINCGQCKKTCENVTNIYYDMKISNKPICIGCGRCIKSCPSSALSIKEDYLEIKKIIEENNKIVIGVLSPEVIYTIRKEFSIDETEKLENKLVTYLKNMGFDFIFNGKFGNDLYIMEETNLLIDRINKRDNLPLISNYCPATSDFISIYHSNLINNLSNNRNSFEMQAKVIKEYFSKEKGLDHNKFIVTVITSCLPLKKNIDDNSSIDFVLTTSELINNIRENRVKIEALGVRDFDNLLDDGTGSALICSTTGGLSESIIRNMYYVIKNKNLKAEYLVFDKLRNKDKIKRIVVKIGDIDLKIAVISNNVDLEKFIKSEEYRKYDYIELMNCSGGCITGGGQFTITEEEGDYIQIKNQLYEDEKKYKRRSSNENDNLKKVYSNYLKIESNKFALKTGIED